MLPTPSRAMPTGVNSPVLPPAMVAVGALSSLEVFQPRTGEAQRSGDDTPDATPVWARIASRGSQRQGKFSAWAARTEAVLVKEVAARPSEPPSVGKHSVKAHGNIKQQRSLDSCSVSLVRSPPSPRSRTKRRGRAASPPPPQRADL